MVVFSMSKQVGRNSGGITALAMGAVVFDVAVDDGERSPQGKDLRIDFGESGRIQEQ